MFDPDLDNEALHCYGLIHEVCSACNGLDTDISIASAQHNYLHTLVLFASSSGDNAFSRSIPYVDTVTEYS
jgi:hypothetical protein